MTSRSLFRLTLLSVLLAAACSHAFAAPSAAGPGLIRQGRYLLCGDDKATLNLLYDGQPLIHGMGIYCGLNGYTRPKDLVAENVVREPGMGGFWHSGVVCHMDEYGNYGHNEACISTAAEYIFAVNAMKSMGF